MPRRGSLGLISGQTVPKGAVAGVGFRGLRPTPTLWWFACPERAVETWRPPHHHGHNERRHPAGTWMAAFPSGAGKAVESAPR